MTEAENSARGAALEELREFIREDDRDGTPIFAGRADELGAVRDDLEYRLRRWEAGASSWKSATWVFQGAPGAGKTALLEHLKETLPAPEAYEELGLRTVWLETEASVDEWKEALANALFDGAGDDLQAQRQVSAGIAWKDLGYKRTRTGPMLTWGNLKKAVEDRTITPRPVLLIIDEIQKVEGEPGEEPQGKFLNSLHENPSNLPVFPVYGGLAWSRERIKDAGGPSRFSEDHVRTLEPLSEAECAEALRNFVFAFGVEASPGTLAGWTETLARESGGWPRHLHSHLKMIGRVLVRNGRNLNAISEKECKTIAAEATKSRDEYYGAQLESKELINLPCLAAAGAAVVARSEQPLQVADLGGKIQEISDRAETPRLRLPEGANGKDFADAMIRAGLLHKSPDALGTLSVPIPSMPDYLLRTYEMNDWEPEEPNPQAPAG